MNNDNLTKVERPSLFSANLLYLACIVLLLTAGTALQLTHFGWGLLATEVLIGLLALIWIWRQRLPWRQTLRLHPASAWSLLLAFVMGIGLWLLGTWLGAVTSLLFGYDVPVPPGTYPQSIPAALLLFVALTVAAPLGEEFFFRGYMQRAYERLRPFTAILLVSLLFAFFHLSLVGLPPRLPVALALGYVAWRSNSLWPGVVLHAANNAGASILLTLIGLRPNILEALSGSVWAPGGPLLALIGLLLLGVALWLFRRAMPEPLAVAAPHLETPAVNRRRGYGVAVLPLLLAGLLFTGVAALEVVGGLFPELLVTEPLALQPLPWSQETTWSYRLQHPGAETVGGARCGFEPAAETAVLSCQLQHQPFDVRVGSSYWAGGNLTRRFSLQLDRTDAALVQGNDVREFGRAGYTVTVESGAAEGELLLAVTGPSATEGSIEIQSLALIDELWPWQLAALPFAEGNTYRATLVYPQQYDHELEQSVLTVREVVVIVGGAEPLSVPAGDYLAWRVTVADDTAWYDVAPPHRLLQYDSGPIIWQYEDEAAE